MQDRFFVIVYIAKGNNLSKSVENLGNTCMFCLFSIILYQDLCATMSYCVI